MKRKKIELFNPSFIRSTADETLRGKPVFFGDSLDAIRDCVESNKDSSFMTGFDYDADREFCGFKVSASPYAWDFVYYDPNYACKLVYNQGKQIQINRGSRWDDIAEPLWLHDIEYRIKPEEQNSEHVVQATEFPSLCGYCIHRKDGCMPEPAGKCANFFSTNDDYFRVKKDYVDLVKEHVELERKYCALVSGIRCTATYTRTCKLLGGN